MIPNEKLRTVYSFTGLRPHDISTAQSIRHELVIPAGARVVGAAGELKWGKGADLLLSVAQKFKEQGRTDTDFVWTGGNPASVDYQEFAYDIEQMGLADRARCVAARVDTQGFYQAFEVLLPSRMDAFPLVCFEAALAQRLLCVLLVAECPNFCATTRASWCPTLTHRLRLKKTTGCSTMTSNGLNGVVGQQQAQAHYTIEAIRPPLYSVIQQFLLDVPMTT